MSEIFRFIMHAGIVTKAVLTILLILSVVSWAIIFEKTRLFLKIKKESRKFLQIFRMHPGWNELYAYSRDFRVSPYPRVVKRFYSERQSWNQNGERELLYQNASNPVAVKKESVSPAAILGTYHSDEISDLEKRMIILSTTVSVSPFLGLLGTVWGIMSAFLSIGATGSADISSVGPGIAEALITTVAGLAVAIPALIAYNYFVDNIRRLDGKLENFSTELIRLMDREKTE